MSAPLPRGRVRAMMRRLCEPTSSDLGRRVADAHALLCAFTCEHTGNEVHLYCLNAWQMAAFVRTGYDPKDGVLPPQFVARLPLEDML